MCVFFLLKLINFNSIKTNFGNNLFLMMIFYNYILKNHYKNNKIPKKKTQPSLLSVKKL